LAKLREDDLKDVLAKVKLHGFTVTDLRSSLKKKGAARKTTATKRATRKTTTRRKPAAK